jgi:hypothetical protein
VLLDVARKWHRCRTLKADNYSITQFGEITPYLIMNSALEFQNPSVYSKSGVTTNMKTAVMNLPHTS